MKKLREYQGVTYRDDVWWYEGVGYDSAIHLLHLADWGSDDDHAALMDLKANPYEPPYQTLKRILSDCLQSKMNVSEVAEVIRAAFPQIDADRIGDANKMVPPLTAAEHIAALVAMGAQEIKDVLSIEHRGSTRAHLKGKDVLILPPEMTP